MIKKSIDPPARIQQDSLDNKDVRVERALIENFVSLQKVMTNLAVKFDSLSTQISKLLELFEISAKVIADRDSSSEDRKVVEKLDSLLEQNKVLAKGIVMLHERGSSEKPAVIEKISPVPTSEIPPVSARAEIPSVNLNRPPIKRLNS